MVSLIAIVSEYVLIFFTRPRLFETRCMHVKAEDIAIIYSFFTCSYNCYFSVKLPRQRLFCFLIMQKFGYLLIIVVLRIAAYFSANLIYVNYYFQKYATFC